MRITPALLMKIAGETVAQRTGSDRDVLAVYLHGSLLSGNPLLGGATDIDLFFVHQEQPAEPREIVRLTNQVHLDIAHHPRALYRQARKLRLDPWLGSTVNTCKILYDPQHFMDFTQASVRGHFSEPDNVLARASRQAEKARRTWLTFQMDQPAPGWETCLPYLEAVEQAGNAVASLNGPPLPTRRFLAGFPQRARAAGRPGLYNGLAGLLGAAKAEPDLLHSWISAWESDLKALPKQKTPTRLGPERIHYYRAAFEEMLAGESPQDLLWPLLSTWTEVACAQADGSPPPEGWQQAMRHIGLLGEGFPERLEALDAYLDGVEETIEEWGKERGAG